MEIESRREQLLAALDEVSRHIRAEKEPAKLLHEIVRLATQLTECTAGCLFINYPNVEHLEIVATYNLPDNILRERVSYQNLIGDVVKTSKFQVASGTSDWVGQDAIFQSYDFKSVVGLPLLYDGKVEAVLFVADAISLHKFDKNELEILERFAAQASIALQTSRLMGREQRMFARLAILYRISDYIQNAKDLDKIFHIVLTGVTAGYGLGLNRAALFLVNQTQTSLIGKMGIGYLEEQDAQMGWVRHHQQGLEDFDQYISLLQGDTSPLTPVGELIQELKFPLKVKNPDIFARTILERRWIKVEGNELKRLPRAFIEMFRPETSLVVVPLMVRDRAIGLLVADNKFTKAPITYEDIELLTTFANTVAIAIDNVQLLHEAEEAREKIRASFEASVALVASQSPEQVLEAIVEQAHVVSEALWVSLILIDEMNQVRDLITTKGRNFPLESLIRENGISIQVMHSGMPVVIRDLAEQQVGINPRMQEMGIKAALCMPLSLRGKQIGVMWVHYDKPRLFPNYEIEAMQLYVNQAAIAYDNTNRMQELELLHKAAEAIAAPLESPQVLKQIVESACEVLQADSSALWSYDDTQNQFIPEELVAYRISLDKLKKFQKKGSKKGGTADTVMKQGWVGVSDTSDPQYNFVDSSMMSLVNNVGVKSFQGVSLNVGNERLGVLYVNYNRPRIFTLKDRSLLETLASNAALALKKAKLLEELGRALKQVTRARNTAQVVAEVTVLEELHGTLDSIVKGTQNTLDCDVVTLYTYDQERDTFSFPPAMVGVKNKKNVLAIGFVANDSVPYKVIKLDEPYVAEDTVSDPLMGSPFSLRESIKSVIGVPLIAGGQKVGVLFANYRTSHAFTDEDLTNVKLFAHQAAVAIENTRLYNSAKQRANNLDAILRISQTAISSLDLKRILSATCQAAVDLLGVDHSGLVLFDKNITIGKVCAEYPEIGTTGIEFPLDGVPAEEQLIQTKQPLLVPDVGSEPGFEPVRDILTKLGTSSVLIIPIVSKGQILGSLGLDMMKHNRIFTEEEIELCKIFVAQVAVAIENARQYEDLKELDRKKTEFLSTVSHELRTPLTPIKSCIENLLSDVYGFLNEKQRSRLDIALASVREESRLIDNLLDLARIQEGKTILDLASEDVYKVIHDVVEVFRYNASQKNITIAEEFPAEGIMEMIVDAGKIKQVITNLIGNALKFTPEGGTITISVRGSDQQVKIRVTDTGIGIQEEEFQKIFDRFYQVDSSLRRKFGGTGIGLNIVKEYVEMHGGRIWIESSKIGEGSTFIFTLPVRQIDRSK